MSYYDDKGSHTERDAAAHFFAHHAGDDARIEARREAAYDDFLDRAAKCIDCGELWDPEYHRATRTDPAYENLPECPRCGGEREEPGTLDA